MRKLIAMFLFLAVLTGCHAPAVPTEPEVPDTTPSTTAPAISVPDTTTPEDTLPPETTTPAPLPEPEDDDLVRVLDYIPSARQALAYATTENFTGQRIYDFTDAYLRYGTVKKLAQACEELAGEGLGILIWDGFRPVSAQARLWEICPDPTFVSNPVTGNRTHCRGAAVDLTLVDLATGDALPMPTGFDVFTDLADRDYSDCPADAAANARLLEQVMARHGFTPYSAEWWHFTDTVPYPVDENFDPAVPMVWYANCEEFISLRSRAGGTDLLATIPTGDTMTLKAWEGKYARVVWQGMEGYVMASYIRPAGDDSFTRSLDVVVPTETYTYEQMRADLEALVLAHPDQLAMEVIGKSELGTEIPVLRIGSQDAAHHVLLQGAIHGREHLTAWLLTAMADYWLDHGLMGYGDICWHIIPMTNPDGVRISQTQQLSQAQRAIYQSDLAAGHTSLTEEEYALRWKANGLGVDINRNFPAGWEYIDDREGPSSERYQGSEPFSTAEARLLRDYTQRYSFDATISYHSTGSIIYYEYGSRQPANDLSKSLGEAAAEISGYPLEGSHSVDGAGYKDWAIDSLGIPSLTIEIGCQESALAERELYSIFVRNYRLLPAIARWLAE